MIAFHGTADRFIPYDGGSSPIAPGVFPSATSWTANWARRNRCGANPVNSVVAADVTRLEFTDCAEGAAVVLYTLKGVGHQWPGGKPFPESFAGPTSNSIDASSVMWEFFVQHPR
jgi:polyhydroxybutyrate depolymerase